MVFGFKKDRNEQEQEVKDPTLIWEFSRGIKIFPNELWAASFGEKAWNHIKTHAPSGDLGTVRMQGPGRSMANFNRAYSSGGAIGVLHNMNTNPGVSVDRAKPGSANARPEIIADSFVLTTDAVKAMLGRNVELEGAYNQKYIEAKIKGAKSRNEALLRAAIPEPDGKDGKFYTAQTTERIRTIEKELPSGFWKLGVLVNISAKEGGTFSDNEFMLHIAAIKNPLVVNYKQEKSPSRKFGFKHANDGEYSVTRANDIDPNAKVTEYKVRIGDKDDKKQGIDIYKKMTDFVAEAQPKVNETVQYAFLRTEKGDKLLLSEQLIKDLNA